MIRSSALLLWAGVGCLLARQADSPWSLDAVAKAATVMLDGDVCTRIQTPRSVRFSTVEDPRDPWRAGDNYDVDADAFNQTKKTLMRLSHLCAEPCDVNLWMPAPGHTGRVQLVIRNVHEWSQFWTWGDLDQETPPEMKQVLETGKRVAVARKKTTESLLSPVYDSLGAIVGVAEVVSVQNADPRENVK
jgi:hypothetical protein